VLDVHTPISLTMSAVNLRRLDIAIRPNNFDIVNVLAPRYERYRVERINYKIYGQIPIPFQQGANTCYPLIVYKVPIQTSQAPVASISGFLGYSSCKSWTFKDDFSSSGAPYSPKEGTLASLG